MARRFDLDALVAALETAPAPPTSDFDLNGDLGTAGQRKLKEAAVLIGVLDDQVILTKRASTLKHHPGQVALPGGKLEPGETHAQAALREAHEEVGLDPEIVTELALLPTHETVTSYQIRPVLARIEGDFTPVPEPGEVAEVFRAPLSFLLDPDNYRVEGRRWRGTRRHYYVVPYGPFYIWGATAMILRSLAHRVSYETVSELS